MFVQIFNPDSALLGYTKTETNMTRRGRWIKRFQNKYQLNYLAYAKRSDCLTRRDSFERARAEAQFEKASLFL